MKESLSQRQVTAIHEAGHAIFDWLSNCNFHVTMGGDSELGKVHHNRGIFNRESAAMSIVGAWGGIIAEARYTDEDPEGIIYLGGAGDFAWIQTLAQEWFGDNAGDVIDQLYIFTGEVVDLYWGQIEKIASILETSDLVEGDEVCDLLGNFNFGRYLCEIVQPAVALLPK